MDVVADSLQLIAMSPPMSSDADIAPRGPALPLVLTAAEETSKGNPVLGRPCYLPENLAVCEWDRAESGFSQAPPARLSRLLVTGTDLSATEPLIAKIRPRPKNGLGEDHLALKPKMLVKRRICPEEGSEDGP